MKYLLTAFLLLSTAISSLWGQHTGRNHLTIGVDSIKRIQIDVTDSLLINSWVGNTILVETNSEASGVSRSLFHHLKDSIGRYDLVVERNGDQLKIANKFPHRKQIRIHGEPCRELVTIRILIPEDFVSSGITSFMRKPEE